MSWQAYVDSSLIGSGKIDRAAIFSGTGDSQWAASPGFSVGAEEIQSLVKGFNDAGSINTSGLYIDGENYRMVKAGDRSIYGRNEGKAGVLVVKTNKALIVAHYPETVQAQEATQVVEQLADYLIEIGY
ncbi:uncharacterized protein N7498_002839 [Penicillium cinerascens]|uniref:Profilin n=1 Tax=Penicillium cinerascens TaxID=70096 RepID=A0A9W9NAV0_9EURO|nr:uncharacterized protein N7498_002839 [Penicillium cinerascens]KAJ5216432.1 hypothetical protein N7498_002839 [Penicillium cinerascens]